MCVLNLPQGYFSLRLEREKERNIDQLLSHSYPNQGLNYNLGICPDWESNPQTVSLQDDAPTNGATLTRATFLFPPASITTDFIYCKYLNFPLVVAAQ